MPYVRLLPILLVGWVGLYVSAARGAAVSVNPVRVHLSVLQRSELVELRNSGQRPARFQAKVYAWHETVDGQSSLKASRDLLFFPSLLEIPPGQTRRIRIASTVPPGAMERSYRLILDEFPGANVAGTVQVLTRLSIPVFVQPTNPKALPSVKAEIIENQLVIWVANAGNTYMKADVLRVVARSSTGEVVLEQSLVGWYVLAGGQRRYDVALSAGACSKIANLHASLQGERGNVSATTSLTPGALCGPGR